MALLIAGLSIGNSATASAQDSDVRGEVSINVAFTNDYVFRGYTQTEEDASIQVGLDWESAKGFYLGSWGSNVNFGDDDEAEIEIDVYGGYAGEIDELTYDFGFMYYLYPGAVDELNYEFWEVYGSIGYDFGPAVVSLGLAYTPDNFGGTEDGIYLQSGVIVTVTDMFSVDVNLNYSDVNPSFGDDYLDWNVGGTLSLEWFDADLRYIDTDISNCKGVCDNRVVFSVTRSF